MGLAITEAAFRIAPHEAEILHEPAIVVGDVAEWQASEHGLDHLPHARLAQALDQAVEVRVLALDEDLARGLHVFDRDGPRGAGDDHVDELVAECVDQPRLALREIEDAIERLGRERLAGVAGMLGVQLHDLLACEAPQGERLHLDVEWARRVRAHGGAARGELVITHVAQADERERPGEGVGAARISGADLAQHGDQRLALEGINLVEK